MHAPICSFWDLIVLTALAMAALYRSSGAPAILPVSFWLGLWGVGCVKKGSGSIADSAGAVVVGRLWQYLTTTTVADATTRCVGTIHNRRQHIHALRSIDRSIDPRKCKDSVRHASTDRSKMLPAAAAQGRTARRGDERKSEQGGAHSHRPATASTLFRLLDESHGCHGRNHHSHETGSARRSAGSILIERPRWHNYTQSNVRGRLTENMNDWIFGVPSLAYLSD